MGSIVGLLSLKGEDVTGKIVSMLETLRHRGPDRVVVATARDVSASRKPEDIHLSDSNSAVAVGRNYLDVTGAVSEIFSRSNRFTAMGEGVIYGGDEAGRDEDVSIDRFVLGRLENRIQMGAEGVLGEVMNRFQGEYVVTILQGDCIFVARDLIGAKPLYFGSSSTLMGFASERKALWRVGLTETSPLPPGHIAAFTKAGVNVQQASTLGSPHITYTSTEAALEEAWRRLYDACLLRVKRLSKVGVLFSGGLDSSVLAALLRRLGVDVVLYTAALEGSPSIQTAEVAAEQLGLKHRVREFTVNEVEVYLGRVLYAIERFGVVDAGVAFPFFFSSDQARREGLNVILSGQGCDEIFGGYARYLRILAQSGYDGLQGALWCDAAGMGSANLGRDDAAVMANSVELRSPFSDVRVVKQVLEASPRLKVSGPEDGARKHLLRRLGEKLGLPRSITGRPKKAAQYSSGSEKALKVISRKRGISLLTLLDGVLREEVAVKHSLKLID